MQEFASGHEPPATQELIPDPSVIETLRGKISEPMQTTSHKPGSEGQLVTIRIVKEGAGMFGLTDWQDNKEWSGIFNHVLLSTRYTLHFAQQLEARGFDTNTQTILNGMLSSHNGRRQWDEARWYPDIVKDANAKQKTSNETLGMQIIQGKIPQHAFELVVALGHNVEGFSVDPAVYDSLDYKTAIYADHRTTQKYEPLHIRMGDFLLGNFFDKNAVTPEIRQNVYDEVTDIIERQKAYRFGQIDAAEVTRMEADHIAAQLGAAPTSERLTRLDLMRLILQDADTEALLLEAGIDVANLDSLPIPHWEDQLRQKYIADAKNSILQAASYDSNQLFTRNTWWEAAVHNLLANNKTPEQIVYVS